MVAAKPQPWSPADATDIIRKIASGNAKVVLTQHAKDQMADRDLILGDLMYVVKNGFVYEKPEPSTQDGYCKYKMESTTPNTNSRSLRVVVIPGADENLLKFVTCMWRDEPMQRS